MSIYAAPHPNVLASSRVLVVGGTSGIGAAVVSAALASGAKVHIASSNEHKISTAIAHLRELYPGASVSGSAGDLSNTVTIEESIAKILSEAVENLGGPLDHIVYTAGDSLPHVQLADVKASETFNGWTVRVVGPIIIGKFLAANPGKFLKVASSSSITLTSGSVFQRPIPGLSIGIAMSGAMLATGRAFSLDFAPVRVNTVVPGPIQTELLESFGEQMVAHFKEKTLLKEIGKPEAAAEAYLFSLRSSFVTGEEIIVDGGQIFA